MRRKLFLLFSAVISTCLIAVPQNSNTASANRQSVWIFFRDKGPHAFSKKAELAQEAEQALTPRALSRRAKVRAQARLIDETDFTLYQPYIDELAKLGLQPIVKSRWLNAVSVEATPEQIRAAQTLPNVQSVRPVARLKLPPVREAATHEMTLQKTSAPHRLVYGASLSQMNQINAPILHDAGITGRGVLVGMMDSGFHWQDHEAFAQLRVLAERDFINDDNTTRNEGSDPGGQDTHGTQTLSTLAGFRPGELIGPAFNADFLLAKTENIASETHAEEQFWVEAIEWMEAQGVDMTSTSLGYGTDGLYSPSDMDGKTAIITIAAEIAASKGVIIVNSAGNEGGNSWNIITAPADGPNVIAVGAVNASGGLVGFSSRGPTADGRLKPDVMAMGSGVYVVSPNSSSKYTFASGTSFSCPLTAGVVAQIVSAHPEVTPQQMLEVLHATASRANSPDNDFGYGILDAKAAVTALGPAFSNIPEVDTNQVGMFGILIRILSRDGLQANSVQAHYAERPSANFSAVTLTQVDSISYYGLIPRAVSDTAHMQVYFTANDNGFGNVAYPKNAPAGVFLIRTDGTLKIDERPTLSIPRDFALSQSTPNPFRLSTGARAKISFALTQAAAVRLRVYNVLGQEVVELLNASREVGKHEVLWNGRDAQGRLVPSGVYFYVLTSSKDQTPTVLSNDGSGQRLTGKMLILQ